MKLLLLSLSFLVCVSVSANTYYFSSTSGDDGRTVEQAQSPLTPWRTIEKLNSVFPSLLPGDSVLFKRGDVFYGAISVTQSGALGQPIVLGAYGSGAQPQISGFQSPGGWTSVGGGIYETTFAGTGAGLNMVTFQDTLQPMGRWPKLGNGNGGYLNLQSHVGTTSITSTSLSGALNYVGGELVIRKYGWILDRGAITAQTSTTLSYTPFPAVEHPNFSYEPRDGYGFFIQNHINTLTQLGEWCYNPSTQKLSMYFGANSPSAYNVRAAGINNLVSIAGGRSYITLDNLSLSGANGNAVYVDSSTNITLNNCNIAYSGVNALHVTKNTSSGIRVTNCRIVNTLNNAINANTSANWVIQNNVIRNTGMVRGMGLSGDGQYNALQYVGSNSLVQYNEVRNTGYIGINFVGDYTVIKNNLIDSFCIVKSDGGGIYTSAQSGKAGRQVENNIVLNGIADRYGRSLAEVNNPFAGNVHGIYMDGGATDVFINANTVANCSSTGLELSSPHNVTATNNTLYNNTRAQIYYFESKSPISNLIVKHNIAFARPAEQLISLFDAGSNSVLSTWGTIDSNYYCRPLYEPQGINTEGYPNGSLVNYPGGGIMQAPDFRFYSLDTWQTLSSQDAHSKKSPVSINSLDSVRFEYNATNQAKTVVLDATYVDAKGQPYTGGSLILAPYSSVVLIRTGKLNLLPQTITFPAIANKVLGDAPFNLSATASSGLPVSYRVVSGPATVAGNTVTLSGTTGTVTIEASQAGNTTYNTAPPVTQSFQVNAGTSPVVKGHTYYFSSTSGDDGRTVEQAQSPLTPWRTIEKLNSVFPSLLPGDSVLFKRGDVFYGAISVTQSGALGQPIVLGAYGSGAQPQISGFQSPGGWTSVGGGIYETTFAGTGAGLNMVTFQDTLQPMGRWPKLGNGNGGYLNLQSHVGTTSITSTSLSGALNYVGGELVIRKYGWILDRGAITAQTSTTLSYTPFPAVEHPNFSYEPRDGYGFFIQNHINTLTQLGEWCYNPSTQKLSMYFGANSPSAYNVRAAGINNLVSIAGGRSYITLDNLSLSGANGNAVYVDSSTNITLNNCNIAYSGVNALHVTKNTSSGIRVTNCRIVNTLNNAINANTSANWVIQNNVIRNTGMVRGMGLSGDGQYNALQYVGSNSLVQYNEVRNTGYIGINFVGDYTVIKNNLIDSFCIVKSDGGGIYTSAQSGKAGRQVENNIVLNGIADRYGRSLAEVNNPFAGNVHGIYMDGGATDVFINANTVANCSSTGLELSSPHNVTATNNTLYNNTRAQIYYFESKSPISNLIVKHNIAFARPAEQLISLFDAGSNSVLSTWGTIDSNYYCRPLYEPQGINTEGYPNGSLVNYPGGGIMQAPDFRFYSLDTWQTLSSQDAHSKKSPVSINSLDSVRFEYNATNQAKTVVLDATYVDAKGQPYTGGSLILAPYSSVVLIRTGKLNLLPQTITFPAIANKVLGDAPFNLSATASSGLPVSYRVVSGPATVAGNTVTLSGTTGTVTIEASQAGNTTYNTAPPVTQSFQVNAGTLLTQTITFPAISNKTTTDAAFTLNATASSGLTITYKVVSGPATVSGNTVTLSGTTGIVTIEASQAGDGTYSAASPITQSFTVTALAPVGDYQPIPGRVEAESYSAQQWVVLESCSEGGQDATAFGQGSWMDYKVDVASAGTYTLNFRVGGFGGKMQVRDAAGTVLKTVDVPSSYGWQKWATVSTTLNLPAGKQVLRIYITEGGFNLNWFEGLSGGGSGPVVDFYQPIPGRVEAESYSAQQWVVLESCSEGGQDATAFGQGSWMDYKVDVASAGTYTLNFRVGGFGGKMQVRDAAGTVLKTVDVPSSYGWQKWATVSTTLNLPAGKQVLRIYITEGGFNLNWFEGLSGGGSGPVVDFYQPIPGRVEAESYSAQQWVVLESCSEGGQDATAFGQGSWMDYKVDVASAGTYTLNFRVGGFGGKMQVRDAAGTVLKTVDVPSSYGWQKWATVSTTLNLPAGKQVLRIYITEGGFNLNWFEGLSGTSLITASPAPRTNTTTAVDATASASTINLYPLPAKSEITVQLRNQYTGTVRVVLVDEAGRVRKELILQKQGPQLLQTLPLGELSQGVYLLQFRMNDKTETKTFIKQ